MMLYLFLTGEYLIPLNPRDDDHLLGDSMLMISEWSHDVLEAKLALVKVSF